MKYKVIMDEIRTYEVEVDAEDEHAADTKARELVTTYEPYDVTWQYSTICVGK